MKTANSVELSRNTTQLPNWSLPMAKTVYRAWRKNMPACNGFTTGGINELVILAYSSNKLVTVPPRSLYKNTTVQSHGVMGYSSCHMSGAEVWCYSQTIIF